MPAEKLGGVTYSSDSYIIKVTVTDNGNGKLTAAADKGLDALVFTNTYAANGTLTLEATKKLKNKALKAGDFSFVLKDDSGAIIQSVSNNADGTVAFNPIQYTLNDVGSHTYTVSEVQTADTGVTYDTTVYTVEVTVTDIGNGTLDVSKTIKRGSDTSDTIVFENIYKGTIDISGSKTWNDADNQDGIRPASIIVKLLANKEVVRQKVIPDANGNWNYVFNNLPEYDANGKIVYTVSEDKVDGYETSTDGYNLINTHDAEKTKIKVTKTWDDNNDRDGHRPDEIKVQLKADGENSGEEVVLNEKNNWTYTWSGLDKKKAGKDIVYTVEETSKVTGYITAVTGNAAEGFIITNKVTSVKVSKVDIADGKELEGAHIQILDKDGNVVEEWDSTKEAHEVTGLKTGEKYTLRETVASEGYAVTSDTSFILKADGTVDKENTNTTISDGGTLLVEDTRTKVKVSKVDIADGKELEGAHIQILDKDGNVVEEWDSTKEAHEVTGLKTGEKYTLRETVAPRGYLLTSDTAFVLKADGTVDTEKTTTVSKDGILLVQDKLETVNISGTKTWKDFNDQDRKRPEKITVNLLANGSITDTKTVTAKDNWTYSFTDLPKYADGEEIKYTVSENSVPEYTTTYNEYDITNSYTPGKTSATITKIWSDSNNQDGKRPESITVTLLADGKTTDTTVTLNASNNWTQTVTDLAEKANGNYITYTWAEVNVPKDYKLTKTEKNGTVTTLTNTHTPELTSVSGTKTWNDNNNQDGKRPTSITVNLLANGVKKDSQNVSADVNGNWTYSFTGLPKYAEGKEIVYTVTEDAVEGYTTELDGTNIINTHKPETTKVAGTKTWNDSNNQDGKRPESITVILLANGVKKDSQTVSADANGNWSYSFTDLPKYEGGKEIVYTVSEKAVPEYTAAYNKYDIINSYTPGKTSATVTKIWDDADNQDGKRPESITAALLADGKETGTTVTLNAENNWAQTVSDLPEKANGKAIKYTWTEVNVPEGYELTGNSRKGTVTTLTNTYVPEKITINGTKTWNDNNNQDGKRPESITVNLLANGEITATRMVTADESGNWIYSFTDLPKYKAGKEIKYTVEEEAVTDYETKVEDYNITNTHKPETTSISGTKNWNDSNNQDGKRPSSITVNLLADGTQTASQVVKADEFGNWTYSFTDLPKYKAGKEIKYTVSENPVSEYTTTYNAYDITNSYTPGKTSATITKIWSDSNNQDGKRPESITVTLLADGKTTDTTVTLNASNNWTQTVTDLAEKANGNYITYTWAEVNVPKDYKLTKTEKNGTVTTLTNTHTPELTSVSGTKTWNDNNDQDGKRPTSITVNLLANGTLSKSQTVSADASGNWTYSFTELPKYADGKEIVYTVTENAVEGYTTELDGNNIINTHKPETTKIAGTKTWKDADDQDGKRPESITVILLANGAEKDRKTVTADEAGKWSYSFTDLPKYADGKEITYTVSEEEVADYTTTYDGNNIVNSYTPGKTSATVTKIWDDAENQDGKRPESITVALLADGKAIGTTVTLNAENNWTQTVSDLQEKANGKAIDYTWTEENVPEGYELTGNSKNGTVTTLTNTLAPEKITITGTKTWKDGENQDGKRPESITVNLFANREKTAEQIVKADGAGNWTYSFTNLPKYAKGEEITYTVTENEVEGYETSVDGFDITNAYTPETTEVKGTKTWNDADNQDGKRPESITVRLHANGEEKDSQTVKADENGNWTYSFENLPKYEAGKEIVYTVTEDAVADYTTEITGYDITNSYAPGKTSVTVTKAWDDNNDRDGHRPDEIRVQLKADGENSGEEVVLNAKNNWTYTWSELDQKKAGKDIAYTVEETSKATGYITAVTGNAAEGFVITNKITSVKISKVDITDQKELAGAHIQIIDKDGNVVEEWDSTWESHEVTGLKTGEKYTLRETVAPEGYAVTSDTSFILKEDGTVDKDNTSTTINDGGTLLVEDSRTSVKVSKVDIADGKELEGAHIQIIDQDGNIVEEWDSTKEAHVTEKLKTGKVYTLRETVAPAGYLLTSDTTFVLKEDGTVDTEKTTTVSKDGVLLVQDSLATSASIAVTKKLTYIGDGLVARNQTFYVALYEDEACTKKVSDVKALEFKNADSSTVVFSENIETGKTYYIAECTQDGISQTMGVLADGTTYEAVFADGNSTTVTEDNGTTTVSFENVFSSFPPDGFYRQGQLTITKRLLGADGDTKNSDKVFYAGIFDDAEHTQLSSQVEQNLITLDMSGGYEVSETINVGLAQSGAKVTLYIAETDANGKPVAGAEDFGYKVTVSADSVTIDEENTKAEVIITNTEEPTVTVTPTPTPSSSEEGGGGSSENHSGGYGSKSPKTGDDTPIGTYVMLLLAAAMLAVETERRRRRNKR